MPIVIGLVDCNCKRSSDNSKTPTKSITENPLILKLLRLVISMFVYLLYTICIENYFEITFKSNKINKVLTYGIINKLKTCI